MPVPADTNATLDLLKGALAQPTDALGKATISQSTGLVAYDLQAPAKNLYPVAVPLRNVMPRVKGQGGKGTNWVKVNSITGSGWDSMGWVPEGQRAGKMSYSTSPVFAGYATIGEETEATYEAISASEGFEDIQASQSMRLLQKMMLKEETAILGGNGGSAAIALGTPSAPTLSAAGSGATLPAATYSVIVVALTFEGYRNSSVSAGVATTKSIAGADGQSFTLNGGASNKSNNATQAVTLGQTLSASVTAIAGAVAYAWFVGTVGNEVLQSITTINSAVFSAPLSSGTQAATAITADYSKNSGLAFDGLLTYGLQSAYAGWAKVLATGTAGTGTVLTSSGRGSVNEIDAMMKGMWDAYQTTPEVLYVNSQELQNISNKVLSNASAPLLQYFADPAKGATSVTAGSVIDFYFNPFMLDGGIKIPIKMHPQVPPGTILGYAKQLPIQYQSNEVPNVAEMHVRRDYYQIDWPIVTRTRQQGVYAEEVLAVYAPFAIGTITNIANG